MCRDGSLLVVLLVLATPVFAQRLPVNATPEHYEISIEPSLAEATFIGRERIRIKLARPSSRIVVNAAEISFDSVTVTAGGRTQRARVSLDSVKEQATFSVRRAVPAGPAEIAIDYRGVLNSRLRGLYLSEANNRRYAVTQLEPTDARRMFPSFDEPAFKATFSLSATIDNGDHAISNGAVLSDTPGPGAGKHTLTFETTPKMSTYLVALAVGDFECSSGSADGIPIRICATPDKKAQTGFALEAAQEILRYLNRYYAVKYPFGKLDVVAVPDFAAGAMENTAAIFYRETFLLADPNSASVAVRKNIAGVLAHEIAHQWFGDLVTMRWWDDIWLNEGFATWMASKPLKVWKPEWHVDLDEVQSNHKAMALDSLNSTRSIRSKASTPAQILQLFDAIAYEKGAAVLRMIEAWVGEEAFRAGVNAYIERFQYGNATAEDFWGALATSTGKPVDRVMAGFVDQPGVPWVGTAIACEGRHGSATVTQERPGQRGAPAVAGNAAAAAAGWNIPVCVKTPDGHSTCSVVGVEGTTVGYDSCPPWVMANAGARGYYRVVNPPEMLRALARDVALLTPAERIALLADEWELVRAGRHDVGSFLDLASGFKGERTAAVMTTLTQTLAAVMSLTTEVSRDAYRGWVSALLRPALDDIGLTPGATDTDDTRALRAALVTAVGRLAGDPGVVAKARQIVLEDLGKPGAVEPSLLNAAVTVAARGGDSELYDRYLARSRAASDREDAYRYLYGLTAFSDPTLVRRTVDFILGPDVRTQDAGLLLAALLGNRDAQALAWELVKARWGDLQKKGGAFGGNGPVVAALAGFCDEEMRRDVERFFASRKVPDAERALRQSIERIEACSALRTVQDVKLAAWLTAQR
jgi:aminopeptidase N